MHKEPMNLTNLRANLYKVVDEIIRTGEPIEVLRNGHKIKLGLEKRQKKSIWDKIEPHPGCIAPGVTDDDLINTQWEWHIDENTTIQFDGNKETEIKRS